MNADKTKTFSSSAFICVHLRLIPLLCLAALISGCHAKPSEAPAKQQFPPIVPPTRPASRPASQNANAADIPLPVVLAPPPKMLRRVGDSPKDPRPPVMLGTKFDIYDIVLPAGSVSRSEAFWKLIDEDKIDPGTYDVLRRNGLRVGIAPVSDWPAMRDLMDRTPSTTHLNTAAGREATNLEISLKQDVPSESIFVFMPDGSLVGRTYERSENLFVVSFQQLPRKVGEVRVAMSPVVRSMRKQLLYTAMSNESEYAMLYPEKTLDVNLWADIPLDNLLVVSPSEEANMPSSVGRAFLMQDGVAERQEHVLVMVPRMFRLEEAATPAPPAAPPR